MLPPDTVGIWLQPKQIANAQPRWGFVQGMQVGIWPLAGPRGLIEIYTPYLRQPAGMIMNYLAIEPIPFGTSERVFSELENSNIDHQRGKIFWSSNDTILDNAEQAAHPIPARGVRGYDKDGERTLSVYIFVEPFNNGTNAYVRLRFREAHLYEVEVSTYTYGNSIVPDYMVVTATMGNKARLRELHLKDGIRTAKDCWPKYNGKGFAPHVQIPMEELLTPTDGTVWFVATPNEINPAATELLPGTPSHWRYYGEKATQYWEYAKANERTVGVVNGRCVYWAGQSPIPGGIAFENFELNTPYHWGDTFVFGISPLPPTSLLPSVTAVSPVIRE
jgi:hypothetical protein